MSCLQQIQVTTQQIAEAISSVLGMDVTIVDELMIRIAGTGHHAETIGQKITGNSIYQKVITDGEEFITSDVSTNNNCGCCKNRTTCIEAAQLCCPIVFGQRAIGAIGLIAFSQEQQLELVHKGERLMTFIRKMAELVAAKAAEQDSLNRVVFLKNQLGTVLNFVMEGIIAIDNAAKIISINYAAEKMLNVKAGAVIGLNLSEVFPGTPIPEVLRDGVGFYNREISIWHKGRHCHYVINAKPMLVGGVVQGVVASFGTAGELAEPFPSVYKNQVQITFEQIIGGSSAIQFAKREARKAAAGSPTVLIMGESGTGKELFARAIHCQSNRSNRPFIAVNCAAIPENLLESEIFGYEEGAFAGAKRGGKAGKIELAHGGTLFLAEIGDMPLPLQAKILRAIQEKTVERAGAMNSQRVDVRMIAATSRDLEQMVQQGQFRQDLYYRLNVFPLLLPPLRKRREDIVELAEFFLAEKAKAYSKEIRGFTCQAVKALEEYNWPGNIRELENAMECAVIRMYGCIVDVSDLPPKLSCKKPNRGIMVHNAHFSEKEAIRSALQKYGHSVSGKVEAAASVGISIATLYRKIHKYGLEDRK